MTTPNPRKSLTTNLTIEYAKPELQYLPTEILLHIFYKLNPTKIRLNARLNAIYMVYKKSIDYAFEKSHFESIGFTNFDDANKRKMHEIFKGLRQILKHESERKKIKAYISVYNCIHSNACIFGKYPCKKYESEINDFINENARYIRVKSTTDELNLTNIRGIQLFKERYDIDMLPSLFNKMPSLTHLNLKDGELTEFRYIIPNLVYLDLSQNALTEFNGNFPNLTRLKLSDNLLTVFRGNLPSLVILELFNNDLTEFSGDFPNLDQLILSGNELTEFGGDFPNLTQLILSGNSLTKFGGDFPKLLCLDVKRNLLNEFTSNLPNLDTLDLRYNQLTQFGGTMPKLKSLELRNNNLVEFEHHFPNLIHLDLRDNKLSKFNCCHN
jgi:hypothetical protein